MTDTQRLSAFQFFGMLYISRMVINVTYSRYNADTNNLKYALFSVIIALPLTILMLIPVHRAIQSGNGKNIIDSVYRISKKFAAVIAIIYTLYFVWVLLHTITLFDVMVMHVFTPDLSVTVLSAIGIGACIYGVNRGIQSLGRASILFFVLIAVALVILVCTLIPEIDIFHFEMPSSENLSAIAQMTLNSVAKNSCIPAMTFLLPLTNGSHHKITILWATAVHFSTALMTFLMVTVLGEFVRTQTFPVYTVTAVASLGVTRRFDGIFMGVWLIGMFVKVSLFLWLFSVCVKKFFGRRTAKCSVVLCSAGVLILSAVISHTENLFSVLFSNSIMFIATLITAVIVPLTVYFLNRAKNAVDNSKQT